MDTWFVSFRPSVRPRARLLCFPYAGGSSLVYARWHHFLPASVEVRALELPGHGRRSAEPCLTDMQELVARLGPVVRQLSDVPLFLFGHSLGALIAFACARALRWANDRLPEQLIVSGRASPEAHNPDQAVSDLSDQGLLDSLRRRGGTPLEILADRELMIRFLPTIRADFRLIDSFAHTLEAPFDFPITALGGARDSGVSELELRKWGSHTRGGFALRLFEGDHFFVNTQRDEVVSYLAEVIESTLASRVSAAR